MNIWEQAAKSGPGAPEHRLSGTVRGSDVANEALVIDRVKAAIAADRATESDAVRIFRLRTTAEKMEATKQWADLVQK